MFYVTDLDDKTQLVIEAETSSAFAKSDLEVRPNPQSALVNAMETATYFAGRMVNEFRDVVNEAGGEAEISYSMKCDHTGLVMLAMNPEEGQFKVTLRIKPDAPRAAAPAAPRKSAWQEELALVSDEQDITDQ